MAEKKQYWYEIKAHRGTTTFSKILFTMAETAKEARKETKDSFKSNHKGFIIDDQKLKRKK